MLNFKCLFLDVSYSLCRTVNASRLFCSMVVVGGGHMMGPFSLVAVQLSGQKEDGLLSRVSPGAQLGFTVLLQGDVPLPVLVFAGQEGVVVVLLQLLQEVAFVCDGGLRGEPQPKVSFLLEPVSDVFADVFECYSLIRTVVLRRSWPNTVWPPCL